MTAIAISKKLSETLNKKGRLTEERVVYVLAEIRKHLEFIKGAKGQYYALRFYSSWALHTKMDRGGADRILRRFDKAYPLLKGDGQLKDLPRDLYKEVVNTMKLSKFKDELREFLTTYAFPVSLVDKRWTHFMRRYGAIIEDCPLVLKEEKQNCGGKSGIKPLEHIDKIVVRKEDAREAQEGLNGEKYVVYRLLWILHGKDKKQIVLPIYNTEP